jgi:hypothetical protein
MTNLFKWKAVATQQGMLLSFQCVECGAFGFSTWHTPECKYKTILDPSAVKPEEKEQDK